MLAKRKYNNKNNHGNYNNTIRDGGSTALYTAYTVDTGNTV